MVRALILAVLLLPLGRTEAGVCKGETPCQACVNCRACKYCNSGKGSCNVKREEEDRRYRERRAKDGQRPQGR